MADSGREDNEAKINPGTQPPAPKLHLNFEPTWKWLALTTDPDNTQHIDYFKSVLDLFDYKYDLVNNGIKLSLDEKEENNAFARLLEVFSLILHSSSQEIAIGSMDLTALITDKNDELIAQINTLVKEYKDAQEDTVVTPGSDFMVFTGAELERLQKVDADMQQSTDAADRTFLKLSYTTEVMAPLTAEKERLENQLQIKMKPSVSASGKEISENQDKKNAIKRMVALSKTATAIKAGLGNANSCDACVGLIRKNLSYLDNTSDLNKNFSTAAKVRRGLANMLVILGMGIIPGAVVGAIKYYKTGSLFFSMQGKSKNTVYKAIKSAEKIRKELQTPKRGEWHDKAMNRLVKKGILKR